MNKIETIFKIGDLVYTVNRYDVDRDVIKAIKVEGVQEDISYGIESKRDGYMELFFRGDGYNWYGAGEVFSNKEEAVSVHKAIKAKAEAKEARDKAKRDKKRLEELKREQEALERGEEYNEDWDD